MTAAIALPSKGNTSPRRPHLTVIEGGVQPSDRYARRRALALATVLLCGWLALEAMPTTESVSAARASVTTPTYQVQRGDTLWSIAGRLGADGDVRDVVDALAEANDIPLDGLVIRTGQTLLIPESLRGPR